MGIKVLLLRLLGVSSYLLAVSGATYEDLGPDRWCLPLDGIKEMTSGDLTVEECATFCDDANSIVESFVFRESPFVDDTFQCMCHSTDCSVSLYEEGTKLTS